MSEQEERHGDAAAVFDCLKYHASAGGEYEYRGTLAIEAFDRICTTLLDIKTQRDKLLAVCKRIEKTIDSLKMLSINQPEPGCLAESLRAAIANAEKDKP